MKSLIAVCFLGLLFVNALLPNRSVEVESVTKGNPVSAPVTVEARIHYPAARLPTLALPSGEVRRVASMLRVDQRMTFGEYHWEEEGVPAGPLWIRVDLARQTLSVFRAGHEIGTAVVLFGADGKQTPSGLFPVLAKAKAHRSSLYDAEMPFMLRLTGDGVAIHASDVRKGAATHGCIGVPLAFARLLFDHVRLGDEVAISA